MNKITRFWGIGLMQLLAVVSFGQEKTGEKFSPEQLTGIERSILPDEKEALPLNASLKSFCPQVAEQNGGTCFAYSSAYAGRTILYNATINNTTITASSTFSPGYIVRQLRPRRAGNKKCSKGASTIEACKLIQSGGVVPLSFYPDECSKDDITPALRSEANKYKIKIRSLFGSCDPPTDKIYQIQQALAGKRPVIIGLTTTKSFRKQNSEDTPDLWTPTQAEKESADCNSANHAICIVGYDDTRYGGVFEILNSWGTDWKNGGFTYVRYQDLAIFLAFGIEFLN